MAAAAAFCVGGGFVLGEFVRAVRPIGYLTRPLLTVAVLAVIVGFVAALFRGWAIVAAVFAMAWIIRPSSTIALIVACLTAGLIGVRLWKHETPNVDGPLLVAAGIFFAAGLVPVVSMMSWPAPAIEEATHNGPPQYAILLDGYPRADTLQGHGVDMSPFIAALEDRGFEHYPEATSKHVRTFQTVSELVDVPVGDYGDISHRRRIRDDWRLPEGWVTIAPPVGVATFPQGPTINPGGFTTFEMFLVAQSLAGPWAGDWVLDGYRAQLAQALELLASTEERSVFAHLFAPHAPILYRADGSPTAAAECWPGCASEAVVTSPPEATGGYVKWLNRKLITLIDRILDRRPDAEVVLFSDHGGRFDPDDGEEWRRVFFAARTPERPGLFAGSSHPRAVFDLLAG